jgi:hypothetical protein
MKVQDNKIFTVVPNSGHLEPGETARILFTYKHTFTGANKLPVLLKIDKGREIMVFEFCLFFFWIKKKKVFPFEDQLDGCDVSSQFKPCLHSQHQISIHPIGNRFTQLSDSS